MEQPKISIIIPVFKKQRYIQKLLNMISEQTFSDFECILVDDGSPDECGEICDRFAERDSRFVVIHIPNGGVSHARNVGLDKAIGEYITFIDADDEIAPNYLENLYKCITDNDVDMVISWLECFQKDHSLLEWQFPIPDGKYRFNDIMPRFCQLQKKSGIFGWCVAKILRRNIVGKNRFTEGLKLAEDFDFYLSIYPKVDTIFFDSKSLYRYRIDADNKSMISASDDQIDYFSQLSLNVKYRAFLIAKKAFTETNREIVNENLSNYSFFVLFHSGIETFEKDFIRVHNFWRKENYPLKGKTLHSKILLFCLKYNYPYSAKMYIKTYRFVRKIVKIKRRKGNVNQT